MKKKKDRTQKNGSKKNWMGVIMSIGMTAICLAGCGSGGQETQPQDKQESSPAGEKETVQDAGKADAGTGPVEINMYHSWSADTTRGAALESLIEEFNAMHEGEIVINVDINSDFPAYQEKVKTMIATDTTPDIFHYNFNPNDLSRQESGKLMDFMPYMDEAWASRFGEGDLETLTIHGELTSIPFEKAGALIYYNKDLFTKAGIEDFPATWEELLSACETLKQAGTAPFSLYTADDAWYTCNLFTYLAAGYAGIDKLNAGGSIDTPEMVKAAETLRKYMDYTTGDFVGANYSVAMNNFVSGKTAIVIDGPWLIGSLSEMGNSVAIAAAPAFESGAAKAGMTVTDAQTPWAAAKQSDPQKEKAIVEFMKFITSEEATNKLTLQGSVFLSARLEASEEEMAEAGELLTQYININSASSESTVNLQRNLSTAANAELPTLLESLALDMITPEEFVKQLDAANR